MGQGQCGHEGCRCMASDGGYCSDYCREHADHAAGEAAGLRCECGHPECQEPKVVPR
jgi:hypothetical protein